MISSIKSFGLVIGIVLVVMGCVGAEREIPGLTIYFRPKVGYEVNGRQVSTTWTGMVDHLRNMGATKDTSAKVSLIVDEKATIGEILLLHGVLQNIGFASIRCFFANEEKTMMSEIVLNRPAIVYQLNPPLAETSPAVSPKP
jgi:hypothetical protein